MTNFLNKEARDLSHFLALPPIILPILSLVAIWKLITPSLDQEEFIRYDIL